MRVAEKSIAGNSNSPKNLSSERVFANSLLWGCRDRIAAYSGLPGDLSTIPTNSCLSWTDFELTVC